MARQNRSSDNSAFPAPPARVLLKPRDVVRLTTISAPQIRRMHAAGKFPKPVRLTEARIAYWSDEVAAWIAARDAERDCRSLESANPNTEDMPPIPRGGVPIRRRRAKAAER